MTGNHDGGEDRLHDAVTHRFRLAWEAGDLTGLHALIAAAASIWVDRGDGTITSADPGEGVDEVIRCLLQVRSPDSGLLLEERSVNGRKGIVCRRGPSVIAILSLHAEAGAVDRIWVVLNPAKLRAWNPER